MFGICTGSLSERNGRPTPWNRPSRSNSLSAPICVEHLIAREIVDLDDQTGAQDRETSSASGVNIAARAASSSTSDGAFSRRQASGSDAISAMPGLERFAPGVPIDPCAGCGSFGRTEQGTHVSKSFAVIAGFAALGWSERRRRRRKAVADRTGGTSLTLPRAHPRIDIYPRQLLYRRCTDWYELQPRPSGTVLFRACAAGGCAGEVNPCHSGRGYKPVARNP